MSYGIIPASSAPPSSIIAIAWIPGLDATNPVDTNPRITRKMKVATRLIAGPAAKRRNLSLLGAIIMSMCSGSANAPTGIGPATSRPKLFTSIPCALA